MQSLKHIDKHRLTIFTDAIIAIIMTILVLDLKVPLAHIETNHDLQQELLKQLPHFWGFVISFFVIVIIWFSHHMLMANLSHATRTLAVLNFLFAGTIATLPFSTALVSEHPSFSLAVALLAGNMLLMNIFLSAMHTYAEVKKLNTAGNIEQHYKQIKKMMGIFGIILLLSGIFLAFVSPYLGLLFIVLVPLMHCIPIRVKNPVK